MINIKSNFLKDLFFGHEYGFKTQNKALRVILILLSPLRFIAQALQVALILSYTMSVYGLIFVVLDFAEGGGKLGVVGWGIILFDIRFLILYIKARMNDDY